MDQPFRSAAIGRIQERYALLTRGPCLGHDRFPQRVVTVDEKLIPGVKAFQEPAVWHAARLAVDPPVALFAREHQIPDSIEPHRNVHLNQRSRVEMIDVRQLGGRIFNGNIGEAIEAFAFLVTVQGAPATSQIRSAAVPGHHERFPVHVDGQCRARHSKLPRCLDQEPPGLDLVRQATEVQALAEPEAFVRQFDAAARPFIREKSDGDLRPVDDVECVDDVVEAEFCGLPD